MFLNDLACLIAWSENIKILDNQLITVFKGKIKNIYDTENLYLLDRIRFDRFFSSKKSKLPFNWNNYDNLYIGISLMLFVLVIVLGR